MTALLQKQIGVGDLIISEREKAYLQKVIASSRLSYGPMSQELESRFAKEHNCKHGIFLNSGTSALHIALAALKEVNKWKEGDEVIVPALTFIATSNIILHNNMKPVFVDIEPDTYNLDPTKIEEKITEKTRCIMPVHLFGQPCSMGPIMEIAARHNLKIIEDSCECLFSRYRGQPVGSFGEISCFSTYIAHFLVTGVGGFCLTNNDQLAIILRSLMNHGRDSIYLNIDDDKGKTKEEMKEVIARRFNFVRLGHSFRATEFEAALGLGQLDNFAEIVRKRRENAAYFTKHLQSIANFLQLPVCRNDREHNFMMYPIVVKANCHRTKEELVQFLEENNIETRDLVPLLNQPVYKDLFGDIERNYPVAEHVRKNGFYIGCHQYLIDEEKKHVVEKIKEFFGQ